MMNNPVGNTRIYGKILNPYDKYKDMKADDFNNTFGNLNKLSELLRDDLFFQHNDSYDIVKNLVIPRAELRMTYEEISICIERCAVSSMQIFLDVSGKETFESINFGEPNLLNGTEWNMNRLYGMLDQIAYATMAVTSPYILSQLLFYVSRSAIFAYIRDGMLKPKLMDLARDAYMMVQKEVTTLSRSDTQAEVVDKVRQFVHALLISANGEILNNTREYLINKRDIFARDIRGEFSRSKYILPSFIPDLILYSDNETLISAQNEYKKFKNEWGVSLTPERALEILRKYVDTDNMYHEKVKLTVKERNEYHGLYGTNLIDGITIEEMQIIIRCLGNSLTLDDNKLLPQTKYAKNIHKIIEINSGFRITWTINNNALTATDTNGKTTTYDYRNPNFEMDIDRDYAVLPPVIRKQLINNPNVESLSDCFLFSTGYVCNPEDIIRIDAIHKNHTGMSKESRVAHRNKVINQWMTQNITANANMVKRCSELLNRTGENAYKELSPDIQTLGSNPVIKDKFDEMIFLLCEIEGIYRMVVAKTNIKGTVKVEEKPKQKEYKQPDIDFDRRRLLYGIKN